MKQSLKKYHKNLAAVIIILALSAVAITSQLTGLLDGAEYRLYDLRINRLAFPYTSRPHPNNIYMVIVDDPSLEWAQQERDWGWPWPRQAYAEFLDYLNLGNPKAVTFDIIFSEPSIYDRARKEEVDDASFAEASKNLGRVVQGIQFSANTGRATEWPAGFDKPYFMTHNFDPIISRFSLSADGNTLNTALFPIEEIKNSAAVVGSFTGIADSDNIIRRHRLFTFFDGKAIPGLAAASLLASGQDSNIHYDAQRNRITWGEYSIPVDKDGKTSLRFRGNPQDVYPSKSMSTVLQSAADHAAGLTPSLPPGYFDDYYVFVGLYGQGLFDIFATPIAAMYPGMGVHITLLDNILMNDFITQIPNWIEVLIIAGIVFLVVVLVLFSGRIVVSVAGLIVSLAALLIAGFWTFSLGWWIPLVAPLTAVILAFITATLYNFATEGKDKRFIKTAFSRILSPKVIDQIISDPSQLKLGGERRKMTAIFTDIQRFSSIASELQDQYGEDGPNVLVNLLNLYLTEMSNIVLENGGTIDKYEGDAIIAFFGAPVWMENHAAHACRSALLMKKREREIVGNIMNPEGQFCVPLAKLIEDNVLRRERPIFTRLGLNTGDMVVGFMGTPSKMDYTIMGNAVNLAARLEGVNKQYDTHGILISEYTHSQIGDEFVTRPLSRVTVVGIPVPLRLYELLGFKTEATAEMLEMLSMWENSMKAFESRNFKEAKSIFSAIYGKDPEDSTAKLYISRCEKYIISPPPPDWDGVDNLMEK